MSLLEPREERPLAARFARWALDCAVRHRPEETRQYGLALAAEVDEATNPLDALRWSLGGIMFFARSVFSDAWKWLKLPAGGSLSGGGADGPSLMPKHSRLITAAVVAVAVLLLALPEGRYAIAMVRASWHGFQQTKSDERQLDELAVRAQKTKTPERWRLSG